VNGCINHAVLHVDLSTGNLRVEHPAPDFYRKYGGGSAMGLYYILKEIPRGAEPLGPSNVLTFFTALPTGLMISGQSRLTVNARSPISGAIGDSQCGGFFPAAFKASGFDGAVISGASQKPVYLYLHDGQAELRDASHLWGMETLACEEAIKAELGDPKVEVAQIGPAGEKMVRFAAIMNMVNRANGRTGMGAVMGSKMLKAVVVKSSYRIEPVNKAALTKMQREGTKSVDQYPDVKGLGLNGTADVVAFQNSIGSLPTRNSTAPPSTLNMAGQSTKPWEQWALTARSAIWTPSRWPTRSVTAMDWTPSPRARRLPMQWNALNAD